MLYSPSEFDHQEKSILRPYNRKEPDTYCDSDSSQEKSYVINSQSSYSHFSKPYPAKILKTKIFKLKPRQTKTKTPALKRENIQRCSTEASVTKKKKLKVHSKKNSTKRSTHSFESNKSCSKSSFSSKCRMYSKPSLGPGKVFDVTKVPNWRSEVNKFIKAVARHKILCPQLFEEVAKIGGLRLLNDYKTL